MIRPKKIHHVLKLLMLAICLMGSSLSTYAQTRTWHIWTAFQSGGKLASNYDIEEYICVTQLTDEARIRLFKEAGKDYTKYDQLRREWAHNQFEAGLRQYAYVQVVQQEATSPLNKDRKTFKITERDYFDRVQKIEDQTLRKWLDQRLGIVKARDAFGAELKKIGYPHRKDQTNSELYFEWLDLQKARVKEDFRLKEVKKYDYLGALGYAREFYVRPADMWDFKNEVESKIENEISDKRLTSAQVTEIIAADKRIPVLIKGIELMGPDSTALDKLQADAPAVFEDLSQLIEKEVMPALEGELAQKIVHYESLVDKLIQKYQSPEKLQELSDEMNKSFVLGKGDFNHFMMGKLYEMAALKLKSGASTEKSTQSSLFENYAQHVTREASSIIQEALDNPAALGGLRLEDHFIRSIQEENIGGSLKETSGALSEEEYDRKYKAMANWVVKFHIKKASLATVPQVYVEKYDTSAWEGQERINEYLKAEQYKTKLENFRRTKLARRGEYISLRVKSDQRIEGRQAWQFVLEQFPSN